MHKNIIWVIWSHFGKIDCFRFLALPAPWQNRPIRLIRSRRPIYRVKSAFFGSKNPEKPSECLKTPKKPYLSHLESFWKNRFFSIFGPSSPLAKCHNYSLFGYFSEFYHFETRFYDQTGTYGKQICNFWLVHNILHGKIRS